MKAIMVMFDSLNRRMLPPYGCDWTKMPNFSRLAEQTVTFENAFVGSMPCMPARRELHTGRYNFLHRGWGPLEPYDDSTPDILQHNGIYTHLTTDHYHYWEDGGCTYHTKYTSWENYRGQEGDGWIGQVKDPEVSESTARRPNLCRDALPMNSARQDLINRAEMPEIGDQPQHKTMTSGMEFIRRNHTEDDWFLHIETFDPHEPYFTHKKYKDLYPHEYDGKQFDWPSYGRVTETEAEVEHCRYEAAALHSMCDDYMGRILDMMDDLDMWKDTMLIVNTDHGFLLGEHDFWAKCHCPFYNEIAHMPLFIWDPRQGVKGERRTSLVQTIDLPATLLEFFGVDLPEDMQGVPLKGVIKDDTLVREAGLFGLFGGQVNVTDGRYVYMRGPATDENSPLHSYTHMPTHMRRPFSVDEMKTAEMAPPFSFTKECPVMRIDSRPKSGAASGDIATKRDSMKTMLFDLQSDPLQEHPIDDEKIEKMMIDHLVTVMKQNDAPAEQFVRLGVDGN